MAKENDEVNRAEIDAFFAHQRTYHLIFCGLTLAVAAFITTVCAWFGASPWLDHLVSGRLHRRMKSTAIYNGAQR
jgi:hypothetical protein